MRKVIGGSGQDNTTAAQAYLAANNLYTLRDLIIIGPPENPLSIWATDHEAPVYYTPYSSQYGRNFPPATMSRGQITSKVGLDVQNTTISLSQGNPVFTANTATASISQLAAQHFYDNWPVQILRAIMPMPGDANTIGCIDWFGGRVDTVVVERNKVTFNIESYLNVVSQKVPSTVIEVTNTLASTTAVTIPTGDASVPVFQTFTGSTESLIHADCLSPVANKIYSGDLFSGGYVVFVSGAGATLAGAWSAIAANGIYTDGDGNRHSNFQLYAPLPWPPDPATDKFYISMAPPINLGDEVYYGFPYVPSTQSQV
jgi:hypothetical protein